MALTYSTSVKLHEPIPLFELPDASGKTYTLGNWADKNVLVMVFACNHCPYSQAVRPQLIELWNKLQAQGKSVQFVAINPNDAETYPEDATEKMKEERYAYPFPYLRDESQEVARDFGAVCTPDIFVYDRNRHLQYRGRLNDNWQHPSQATRHDLSDAIDCLLRGERCNVEQYPSMGCSIKWKQSGG